MENYLKKTILKLLKPCPFCGGTDIDFRLIDKKTGQCTESMDSSLEEIRCLTCGCNMQRSTGVGVCNSWNTRK
jgi:hypothetical protein